MKINVVGNTLTITVDMPAVSTGLSQKGSPKYVNIPFTPFVAADGKIRKLTLAVIGDKNNA